MGLASAGRFSWSDAVPYIVSQVVGAILASAVLYVVASGRADFSLNAGFAANGFGEHSPGGYSLKNRMARQVPSDDVL